MAGQKSFSRVVREIQKRFTAPALNSSEMALVSMFSLNKLHMEAIADEVQRLRDWRTYLNKVAASVDAPEFSNEELTQEIWRSFQAGKPLGVAVNELEQRSAERASQRSKGGNCVDGRYEGPCRFGSD